MYTIANEAVRREYDIPILFHKRPNRVHLLVTKETGQPIGVRMDFFPHDYAGSPTSYFTNDNGETFRYAGYEASPESTIVIIGCEQTNAEIVTNLRTLLAKWHEGFRKDLSTPASTTTTRK